VVALAWSLWRGRFGVVAGGRLTSAGLRADRLQELGAGADAELSRQGSACPFGPGCPVDAAARPMITEISQPITCFISTKSEILRDPAASRARAPRVSPRTATTALTATTATTATTSTASGHRVSAEWLPGMRRVVTG
jgi:hypothetical protein